VGTTAGTGFVYFTNAGNGTSLVTALAAPILGNDPPSRHRAGFDRYDDPHLLALQSVQRAAVEGGADAARERLRAISANPSTRPSADEILQFGAFFAGRGLAPLSIEVLERAVAEAPNSARAHLALGRALEAAGNLEAAIASYRRALAMDSTSGDPQRQIQWAEERLAARAQSVVVPAPVLERYAGRYQDQVVALRDGRLYYKGGFKPESPLAPMADDLFEVEADPTARVQFVTDGAGPAAKLLAIYSDGTMDEAARSR
jgi:tetratricopeptide (TPR) repeat protein